MRIHIWNHPVELNTSVGDYRIVASTEEAVLFLLKHWPIDAAGELIPVRNACMDALTRAGSADEARMSFIGACERIGVHAMVPEASAQGPYAKYDLPPALEGKSQSRGLAEVDGRETHRTSASQRSRPYRGAKPIGNPSVPAPGGAASKPSFGIV